MKKYKQKAIICDIDGVIFDSSQVFKEIEEQGLTGDAKWDYFDKHANALYVYPIKRMIEKIYNFYLMGYKIIFLTARSQRIERETADKIYDDFKLYSCPLKEFIMLSRADGDYSSSDVVKEKHLKKLKKEYEIICAYDDEEINCEMFKRNKILTVKV